VDARAGAPGGAGVVVGDDGAVDGNRSLDVVCHVEDGAAEFLRGIARDFGSAHVERIAVAVRVDCAAKAPARGAGLCGVHAPADRFVILQ